MRDGRRLLARLVPMVPENGAPPPRRRGRRTLSRFALLRRAGRRIILESPLAAARVELTPAALPLLAPVLDGRGVMLDPGCADEPAGALLALLERAGLLTPIRAEGSTDEDADPDLATWEAADLLFHARSRLGRHDQPAGATFEHLGTIPPLPAVKPAMSRWRIPLPTPDLDRLARTDPPLTAVLERRRSVRNMRVPLTLEQLGEFLYRVARVRSVRRPTNDLPCETSSRPYPSGGACYPLELYLAVRVCEGLDTGLYHYDPRRHRLEALPDGTAHVEPLLADTRFGFAADDAPVLIVITARFARVSWKYRSMAYATVLKDAGVLMQTMYLVATAMGLASCAVGCGDADRSAAAIGSRYAAESSVGEFLLGGGNGAA